MDLSALWQEHKIFILVVLGAFLVFVITESYIGGTYAETEALQNKVKLDVRRMRKDVEVKRADLSRFEKENKMLKEKLEALADRVSHKRGKAFALLPGEREPDLAYNRICREAVDTLVEGGAAAGVDIERSLGLPDTTPRGQEEIDEHLKFLDLIFKVVQLAIDNGVKSVSKIKIIRDKGSKKREQFFKEAAVEFEILSPPEPLCILLEDLQRPESYLPLGQSSISLDKDDPDLVKGTIRVLTLDVDLEKPFEAQSTRKGKRF